jgi:plasmid stabilization system protein ParE
VKLRISEEAQADIERIDAWWQEHRDKNSWLFQDELAEALGLIESNPRLGCRYEGVRKYRWVLLRKSHYLVFYEYFPADDLVAIISVWSPRRGDAPPLK